MYLAVFKSFPIILVFDALSCISQGSLHFLRRHLENVRGLRSSHVRRCVGYHKTSPGVRA